MNDTRDFDRAVARWLDAGSDATPPEVIDAVLLAARRTPQERDLRVSWSAAPMTWLAYAAAVVAVVAVAGVAALYAFGAGLNVGTEPTPQPPATQSQPASEGELPAEVTALLDGFLKARVAGEGAQPYLNGSETDIPLLYAASNGAAYERAEFEPVTGIGWPYGWTAFRVRLFAGDTVVEQLFFTTPDGGEGLAYQSDGFGTDIASTTEDGQPIGATYTYFEGDVTVDASHPWMFHEGWAGGRLIPEGATPTTDGGERNDWDALVLVADPVPIETGCQTGSRPADADALVESLRSDADLEATAPVAVSVGGAEALMMDVVIAAGASVCDDVFLRGLARPTQVVEGLPLAAGDRMRLYVVDVPSGLSMRTLAIAVVAPESRFESAVEAAAPVVDSIEFHAP